MRVDLVSEERRVWRERSFESLRVEILTYEGFDGGSMAGESNC